MSTNFSVKKITRLAHHNYMRQNVIILPRNLYQREVYRN